MNLDKIAEGNLEWINLLDRFYEELIELVERYNKLRKKIQVSTIVAR